MKNLKSPLGVIGILYIVFGLVMNIWMFVGAWWPTYLYFISIGIGIFLLLINGLTKRLPKFKIWQTLIGISPVVAFYIFIQVTKASDDVFIIPADFKGTMVVIYGQDDGEKKEFENGKRLYRIPHNGILKTQFELKGETAHFGEYYFLIDDDNRLKIESFPYNQPFPDSTKIYVHNWQLGSASDSDGNKFKYQQVTIGAKIDSFETDIFQLIEIESQSLTNSHIKVEETQKVLNTTEQIETSKCTRTITDFLILKRKDLQIGLFAKIDSIRKVQYPDNDQETSIMVDLTAEYLTRFLNDLDSDSLTKIQRFEKEYHFSIAPKGFTDPADCKDKIAVSLDEKDCSFRLNIYNTFLVEPNWCTESMVVYGFKIKNNRIIDFWRQEAG
jgi:hypothetical protein